MGIRIVHLSDLHIHQNSEFDQRVLIDALLEDLKQFAAKVPIDLIVFTGDLASRGKASEFEMGRKLLLDRLVETSGLTTDRVVLVPGNHDVDCDAIDPLSEDGLRLRLISHDGLAATLSDERQASVALTRLKGWYAFSDGYYGASDRQAVSPGGWTREITIRGIRVGIAALNSAWRSTGAGEEERGRLVVGEIQARTALDRLADCDVRLVAVHHPLEWLTTFDRNEVRGVFERAGAVVMTGHEHEANPMHLVSGLGASNLDRAGCLYFGLGYPNAYSVIDLDLDNAKTFVNVRTWQPRRRAFDSGVDAAEGGVVEMPLPQKAGSMVTVPHGNIAAALVDLIRRTSVVAEHLPDQRASSVSELLVAPRFYSAPFAELAAATMQRGKFNVEQTDGLAVLAENRIVVVVGEPDAGVTAALAWLLEHRHEVDSSRPAIYMRFDIRQGKRVIDEDLMIAATKIGWHIDRTRELPPALVGVDDVIGDADKALARLLRHIAEHPQNVYLLGCHSEARPRIAEALTDLGIESKTLFLGPMNRPSEVRQLVRKMLRMPSKAVADKVLSVLSAGRLPRTPFLMAALTAVLYAGPDVQALDPTAVIDRYIDLLLGRTDIFYVGRFDFRRREHVLEFLAGRFTTNGAELVLRRDVEAWIDQYLEGVGDRKTSPDRLLEEFIGRGLLMDLDGYVGFRHPAIQHVLAAKLMREPDQGSYAQALRADAIRHRDVLKHAAALLRNDRDLLVAVARATTEVLKACKEPGDARRLDSLVDFGEARYLDPKELAKELRARAPKPGHVVEAELDEIYERLGMISAAAPRAIAEPQGAAKVLAAVGLLSSVVASSELVTDADLRTELLKTAISGWGVAAVEMLKQEEGTHELFKLFREVFAGASEKETQAVLDNLVRISVMIGLLVFVMSSLGSRQVEAVLASVLSDDEFMAGAVNALIAVWLAANLRISGWVSELKKLYRHHHKHTFVREVTLSIALTACQSPSTSDEDASILEAFVQEIYGEAVKGGAQARAATVSKVQARLRRQRARAKLAFASGDLMSLGAPDEDDTEESAESA